MPAVCRHRNFAGGETLFVYSYPYLINTMFLRDVIKISGSYLLAFQKQTVEIPARTVDESLIERVIALSAKNKEQLNPFMLEPSVTYLKNVKASFCFDGSPSERHLQDGIEVDVFPPAKVLVNRNHISVLRSKTLCVGQNRLELTKEPHPALLEPLIKLPGGLYVNPAHICLFADSRSIDSDAYLLIAEHEFSFPLNTLEFAVIVEKFREPVEIEDI